MKKLSKIEKKIWKTSFENSISNAPDINKIWESFEKRLDSFDNYSSYSNVGFFQNLLSYFLGLRLSSSSIISFILILIISAPVAYNFLKYFYL